jgi:hypothetical protein
MNQPANVSAFIRSYRNDFRWLQFCLRSLQLRGSQFAEIVVAVPQCDRAEAMALDSYGAKLVTAETHALNGYIDQQITKCHADKYCTGDFIMHLDSDCMAEREIELLDFFDGSRPKLLFRRWDEAGDAKCWHDPTKSALVREPCFETMASLPIIYHRSSHELFRRYIEEVQGNEFTTYVSRLSKFSEFNAIGNFCHLFTPDAYSFVRAAGPSDGYPRPLKQFWSHGGIKAREMEELLK